MGKPAPKPVYVFRPTHQDLLQPNNIKEKKDVPSRAINHLEFIHHESLSKDNHHLSLLSVDNHGWASIWNLDSRRIHCLWHPHPNTESIGGCLWASPLYYSHHRETYSTHPADQPHSFVSQSLDQSSLLILSQGRDHKLKLNQIENYIETSTISTIARANLKPTITSPSTNVKLVAETSINSTNFCKASLIKLKHDHQPLKINSSKSDDHVKFHSLVAVPGSIIEEVDIFGIQIEQTPKIIKIYHGMPNSSDNNKKQPRGSVVAVQLLSLPGVKDNLIVLLIGYESGQVDILKNERLNKKLKFYNSEDWEMVARFKGHTEPILSLTSSIDPFNQLSGFGWSVGADRNIVKYHFSCVQLDDPDSNPSSSEEKSQLRYQMKAKAMIFETNQVGRFDIKVRSDSKVLGIYNWGGKVWLFDTNEISINKNIESFTNLTEDEFNSHEYIKLNPIALLTLPTDPSNRSGVLAFAPFPPPITSSLNPTTISKNPIPHHHHHLDSLVGLALLVASGLGGQVTAWEVFPEINSNLTQSLLY